MQAVKQSGLTFSGPPCKYSLFAVLSLRKIVAGSFMLIVYVLLQRLPTRQCT